MVWTNVDLAGRWFMKCGCKIYTIAGKRRVLLTTTRRRNATTTREL